MIISTIKGSQIENALETMAQGNIFYIALFSAIIVPILEEILFRYLPYKKLIGYGEKTYILVTATVFALIHMNLFQIFYAFLLGAIMAYAYCKTRNMAYNIALHIAINFYGMIISQLLIKSNIALTIAGVVMIVILIIGIVMMIKSRKTVTYDQGEMPVEKPVKCIVKTSGFWIFAVITIAMTVLMLIL